MSTNNGISSDLEFQDETPTLKENFLIEGEENKKIIHWQNIILKNLMNYVKNILE